MQVISRVFNLRPGDFARGVPLFLYYFLIITFYMFGRSARDSIFQSYFPSTRLAYADIAVALLSSAFVAPYLRAARTANLRNLQVGALLLFAVMLPLLWWGVHVEQSKTVAALLYVWVGVCGILAVSQVWMLANAVWTTREAKRLFSILGSGGIVGGSLAGFLTTAIAHSLGTDSILLFMAGIVLACVPIVPIVWRDHVPDSSRETEERTPQNLRDSARLVVRSPHLRAIAVVILLGSVVTSLAGWQYKAIAKAAYGNQQDALTAYYGAVAGYIGIASLAAQLLLTTKLLRRFGIGLTLLILPFFLMAGSVAVLASGALWASTLLRGSDGVFRYSVDTSAVQLLYLPVPAKIKLQVKSFIDTVVWKIGDGLSGLAVLVFAIALQFTPRQVSVVTLALTCAWIVSAVVARRQYVATLRANIQGVQGGRLRPGDVLVPMLDQSTTNVLAEKLSSPRAEDVLYGLTLFEMGQRVQSHAAVRKLLAHPAPEVRRKAMAILDEAGDQSVRLQVAALLKDEDLGVRTEALRYLTRHDHGDPLAQIEQLGEFSSAAVRSAAVSFLGRPGDGQNVEAAGLILDRMVAETGDAGRETRLEAARVLASLPDHFEDQLEILLNDPDPAVCREALGAAGQRRRRRFVPAIIERLADPAVRGDAVDALVLFEDGVVGTLRDHLVDPNESLEVRQVIPEVLRRIGTPLAAAALGEALLEPDLTLRFRVISALNKLQETTRDLALDRQTIDAVMIAELMGHYRSYQLLGTMGGVPDDRLKQSMAHELERIFRLMKLLSPKLDLKEAYAGARSSDAVMHANALEFLDNILSPELRTLIVPLLDSEVTIAERVKLADRFLGFSAGRTGAPGQPSPRIDPT
ncbi:MAG TPA: Npt1/Npt2 family nucleotide transporter [Vicinamibacterales bacterium]|nr:Npt1/Npt2 family nucleotide transporter [Vicinamibacterales bacterium]